MSQLLLGKKTSLLKHGNIQQAPGQTVPKQDFSLQNKQYQRSLAGNLQAITGFPRNAKGNQQSATVVVALISFPKPGIPSNVKLLYARLVILHAEESSFYRGMSHKKTQGIIYVVGGFDESACLLLVQIICFILT